MSTAINQKAYLQKYLSGPSGDKKKKKKKSVKGKGFKIIDDDLDLSKLRALDGDELDILDQGEDAPQIAGIIDERPEEIKKLEQFKTNSKWRVINQDDGFNSRLKIEEIKNNITQQEKENEVMFGKMYSDSEDDKKNDSDLSPPRNHSYNNTKKKTSPKHLNNSSSDFSPPRRNEKGSATKNSRSENERRKTQFQNQEKSDSDCSPPRKYHKETDPKESKSERKNYDSDMSPPRKKEVQATERVRKPSRWGERDHSSENLSTRSPSHDISPSRKSRKQRNSQSPHRHAHKSVQARKRSPSFNNQHATKRYPKVDSNVSANSEGLKRHREATHKTKNKDVGEEQSREKHNETVKRSRKKVPSDSDISPPRNSQYKRKNRSPSNKRSDKRHKQSQLNSDSDLSPVRKENKRSDNEKRFQRNSESPPPSNKKMARTLEGKKAGLQDAKELRNENETFRRKEDEAFHNMTDEVSGRNAQVVSRKSKRETSEDRQKQREKAERQKELDEKYKKWGKGLKQLQDQESRIQDFMHEASKPLARHRNDRDLEDRLRDVERDGDPMLDYIRDKKREKGELGPEKPQYKGNFPPNRFNIRPGYRWDGVDRSNGYEKKFFEQQSKRKANEEEVYKWSTEDL